MIDRYDTIDGCRLDTDENHGTTGPALDLHGRPDKDMRLWVRESGTGTGKSAEIPMSTDDIEALRDGCNRVLLAAGRPVAMVVKP
jgi:hypothetical protein